MLLHVHFIIHNLEPTSAGIQKLQICCVKKLLHLAATVDALDVVEIKAFARIVL